MTLGCDSVELVALGSLSRLELVSGVRIAAVGSAFFEKPGIESVGWPDYEVS